MLPITDNPRIDRAIFDPDVLAAVQRLIPPERICAYLRDLERLLRLVGNSPANDTNLGYEAHKIVSQAGMLGLTRISERARVLEDACRSGVCRSAALQECRSVVGDIEQYALPATRQSRAVGITKGV